MGQRDRRQVVVGEDRGEPQDEPRDRDLLVARQPLGDRRGSVGSEATQRA
jgi:hypothetical protein